MSCPNRDGTAGTGGCSFCSLGGSGDFAEPLHASVTEQIEATKQKMKGRRYIAYFQSYTNTYAPVDCQKALRESGAFQGEWFGGSTAPPSI